MKKKPEFWNERSTISNIFRYSVISHTWEHFLRLKDNVQQTLKQGIKNLIGMEIMIPYTTPITCFSIIIFEFISYALPEKE